MKKLKEFLKTNKSLHIEFGLRVVIQIVLGINYMSFFEVEEISFIIGYGLISIVMDIVIYVRMLRRNKD